jgi:hypothetical protein
MLKTVSSVANALGALNYKGTWDATTNTPTLASGVGTQGDYYVVSVAGATDLDGITNWGVGDWAAFNGSVWQRVEGGADGNFVDLDVTGTSTFGNIQINLNTISSTNTNGNIDLNADGTGFVEINKPATAGIVTGIKMINPQNAPGSGDGTNIIFQTTEDSGRRSEIQGYSNNNYGLDNGLRFLTQDGSSTPRTVLDLPGGAAGDVKVSIGNLVIGTLGKGIDFSATAGTGTSELLDDYEEGDWTPAFANIGTGTYTSQVGRYTKVGNLVTASVHIDINVLGTASGSVDITNLPFTASAVSNNYGSASSIHAQSFTTAAEGLNVLINPNTAVANVYSGSGATSAAVNVTHAVMGTGNLLCTLVYFAA